jgi:hypothetical protein
MFTEPVFSPGLLFNSNPDTPYLSEFCRSSPEFELSEPYQEEVNSVANLLIANKVKTVIFFHPNRTSGPHSEFNSSNPFFLANPGTTSDSRTTQVLQFGSTQNIFSTQESQLAKIFDKEETMDFLSNENLENSLQYQILLSGHEILLFDIRDTLDHHLFVDSIRNTIFSWWECHVEQSRPVQDTSPVVYVISVIISLVIFSIIFVKITRKKRVTDYGKIEKRTYSDSIELIKKTSSEEGM